MKKIVLFLMFCLSSGFLLGQSTFNNGIITNGATINGTFKIGAVTVTSSGEELNILDGVLATSTEINRLVGVTSAIQTQFSAKANIANPSFTTRITTPAITLGEVTITATGTELNKLSGTPAGLSATELGYMDGVTSGVQSQLDAKQATLVSGTNIKTVAGTSILGSGNIPIVGTGTVTSVAVTTANGVSASVADPTGAANATFTLGAITPTSVNGITLSGSSTPTLAVTGTSSISGTNTGNNAVNTLYSSLVSNATHTGDATGSTALTVVKINGTQLSSLATGLLKNNTGTGAPSIASAGTDYVVPAGNVATATKLATARNINGIAFDGSTNITVPSNITPSTSGNIMTSNGSVWTSAAPPDTVGAQDVLMLKYMGVNAQIGTSYTLILTDAAKLITMTNGSANTVTIPPTASVAFPYGATHATQVTIACLGAGTTTITEGAGVTLISKGSLLHLSTGAGATLVKVAVNTWWVTGGLE